MLIFNLHEEGVTYAFHDDFYALIDEGYVFWEVVVKKGKDVDFEGNVKFLGIEDVAFHCENFFFLDKTVHTFDDVVNLQFL